MIKSPLRSLPAKLLALAAGAALLTTNLSAQIFWANDAGFDNPAGLGSIWRMELDGSNPHEIVSNLNRPIGVAVDEANGHVYWAEDGAGDEPSRIRRANLDGSNVEDLFDGDTDGFTNAQMIVKSGDALYWTTFFGGVMTGNADGTGSPTLLGGGAGSTVNYTAIDVDESAGRIYYGEPNGGITLFRMDLDGSADTWIYAPMVALAWSFNALAIDEENGYVFYGDVNVNTIRRRDTNGNNEVIIATDATQVHGISLVNDEIYWTARSGVIGKVSTAENSTSEILADDLPTTTMFGIAVIPASDSPFALWLGDYGIDPTSSGPNDDDDGDGIPNVVEYALGGDPTAASTSILPTTEVQEVSGETYLTFTHLRRAGGGENGEGDYAIDDLTYAIEGSDDLSGWNTSNAVFVSASTDGAPEGFEFATYRSATPVSGEARQFLRLQASIPGM